MILVIRGQNPGCQLKLMDKIVRVREPDMERNLGNLHSAPFQRRLGLLDPLVIQVFLERLASMLLEQAPQIGGVHMEMSCQILKLKPAPVLPVDILNHLKNGVVLVKLA